VAVQSFLVLLVLYITNQTLSVMKKLYILLLLGLCLSFTACKDEEEQVKPEVEQQGNPSGDEDMIADPPFGNVEVVNNSN